MDFTEIGYQEAYRFLPPRLDYRQPYYYSVGQSQIANDQSAGYYEWNQVAGSSWMHPHPTFPFHQRLQLDTDYYSLLNLRSNLLQCMGFRGWFVIPDESVDKIQFCTYGVNDVGSPIITFTIEIHATHEWQLKLPSGILSRDHHDLLQALPLRL